MEYYSLHLLPDDEDHQHHDDVVAVLLVGPLSLCLTLLDSATRLCSSQYVPFALALVANHCFRQKLPLSCCIICDQVLVLLLLVLLLGSLVHLPVK